jgi:peptidylprolyl isomerase
MKISVTRFSIATLLALLVSASLHAQSAPPAKPKPAGTATTHKAATSTAAAPKLPANIPVVRGIPKTLVKIELKYIDSKLGTGELAKPGWNYTVHYTGWLYNGTKFDSSVDRGQPFDFQQGAHRVIAGWDQGFAGMKVGGKRRLFIPYQLAYGEAGRGPIPAKSDLIFDIEFIAQSDPNSPPAPPAQPSTAPQPATPPAPPTPRNSSPQ